MKYSESCKSSVASDTITVYFDGKRVYFDNEQVLQNDDAPTERRLINSERAEMYATGISTENATLASIESLLLDNESNVSLKVNFFCFQPKLLLFYFEFK